MIETANRGPAIDDGSENPHSRLPYRVNAREWRVNGIYALKAYGDFPEAGGLRVGRSVILSESRTSGISRTDPVTAR